MSLNESQTNYVNNVINGKKIKALISTLNKEQLEQYRCYMKNEFSAIKPVLEKVLPKEQVDEILQESLD